MLHTRRELRDAAYMLECRTREGVPEDFYEETWDLMRGGQINGDYVSLRNLFEYFVPDGYNVLRDMEEHQRAHLSPSGIFVEAGDVVSTDAFSNIFGQLQFTRMLKVLDSPAFIGDRLFTTVPAATQGVEIVPGVAMIGDVAEDIGEAAEYPHVGLAEEYIAIEKKIKDGFILPITEEVIWEDKTGDVNRRADKAAEALGIRKEKQLIDTAIGVDNRYSRNGGPKQATYGDTHTQGDFDNNRAGAGDFTDYTDIDENHEFMSAITDPNTGEPVFMSGKITMLVPTSLNLTALRVINSTRVEQGAITATVPVSHSANPLTLTDTQYDVITSQYVTTRMDANSDVTTLPSATYFFGDFKGAFEYREVWPTQLFRMNRNSDAGFSRDIVTAVKVRRKGIPAVVEPRKVIKVIS